MIIEFEKYQGTGNDFIMIDDKECTFPKTNNKLIKKLCDRRFGVGADGLILISDYKDFDFYMHYFNSDGFEGSMCGNGGRCAVAFSNSKGISGSFCQFMAVDGMHSARIENKNTVMLKMKDVATIETGSDNYFLDTGSPHYVVFKKDIQPINTVAEGRKIRYNERFNKTGTNVNFAQITKECLIVSTYERGVEDETYSCGTGAVATVLCEACKLNSSKGVRTVATKGGNLNVHYSKSGESFTDIWLEGPAKMVYSGQIDI